MNEYPRLRKTLLAGVYTAGILGILATSNGGDDNGGNQGCSLAIRGIAPLLDGSVWAGVLADPGNDPVDLVVRLDPSGIEQARFVVGNAGSDNSVRVIAAATDANVGDVYVGGDFAGGILRLNSDGTIDAGFNVGNGFNGRVTSIAPLAGGDVYVGGYFGRFHRPPAASVIVSGLVRLNSDGSRDTGFIAAPVSDVETVAPALDPPLGPVYSGGTGSPSIERWSSTGTADTGFNPSQSPVLSVVPAFDTTGAVYVGGGFLNRIVRLNANGSVDSLGFNVGTGFNGDVVSIARGVAGDIYVGGRFTTYQGSAANGIVRLNSDGSADAINFATGSGFSTTDAAATGVVSVAHTIDGSLEVFVGGGFTDYNSTPINGLVRLNVDGSVDSAFAVDMTVDGVPCNNNTLPDSIFN